MSYLMMKDETVLELKDEHGDFADIGKVVNPELLPFPLKKKCDFETFKKWLDRRGIPESREGLKEMTEEFGENWLRRPKSYSSLSDQYWIRMRGEQWKNVNFFTRAYSSEIGDMAFSPWKVRKGPNGKFDTFSPDLTTNGILKKRWMRNPDGTSCLIKAASIETHQEPLNEVLASMVAEKLDIIPYVKYDLWIEGTTMCSKCDNFVTRDTDFVPASDVYFMEERGDGETVYSHLVRMCEKYGIPGAEQYLDALIFIDTVTGNDDRNLGNIGFIRDVGTMKFKGFSPMFDCGNAYWNSKDVGGGRTKSKLFASNQGESIKKVMKMVDLSKLMKAEGWQALINEYPRISDFKKGKMIDAIAHRNKRFELGTIGGEER